MPVLTVETRPGTEADVMPDRVLRPVSVEELVAVLHTTPAERTAVIPVGAGTKTGWAEPSTSCHIVLATTGPGRVVAEAVERHEVLQAQVGQAGQMPANASRPSGDRCTSPLPPVVHGPQLSPPPRSSQCP